MDTVIREGIQSPGGVAILCLLAYCLIDSFLARALVRRLPQIPLVGSPSAFTPRFVPNLIFAWKAAEIVEKGYHKVCHESTTP